LDERVKNKYEKKGIACYQLDFEKSDKNEIKELFSTLNISGAKYIFFCGESDLENFSLYANVIQRIKPKKSISTYVHCESGTVAGYMEELLENIHDDVVVLTALLPYALSTGQNDVLRDILSDGERLQLSKSLKEELDDVLGGSM